MVEAHRLFQALLNVDYNSGVILCQNRIMEFTYKIRLLVIEKVMFKLHRWILKWTLTDTEELQIHG